MNINLHFYYFNKFVLLIVLSNIFPNFGDIRNINRILKI